MRTMQLGNPAPAEQHPLSLVERETPSPGRGQMLLRVAACGVCHTDLHTVEGELDVPRLPLIPGHQIVGSVAARGEESRRFSVGQRVGVAWLGETCGTCRYCTSGRENLCTSIRFTGLDIDGGYAEYAVVDERYAYNLPDSFDDLHAAPLLCAGVIGFRSLRLAEFEQGGTLGLFGFGASAHIAIQLAVGQGCEVYVFTRSEHHRRLAEELGAAWVGGAEDQPPKRLSSAVVFAPSGRIAHRALALLDRGGTLALNAIHMSPIPEIEYPLLYFERTLRSVANATRQDAVDFLARADALRVKIEATPYSLEQANDALSAVKKSTINGAAVLVM